MFCLSLIFKIKVNFIKRETIQGLLYRIKYNLRRDMQFKINKTFLIGFVIFVKDFFFHFFFF